MLNSVIDAGVSAVYNVRENGFYDRDLGDIIMTNHSFAAEYFYFSFICFWDKAYLSLTAKEQELSI